MVIKTECGNYYADVYVYTDDLRFLYNIDVDRNTGEINLANGQWLRPIDQYAMDLPLEVLDAVISVMY